MSNDASTLDGVVTWELRGSDGELKKTGTAFNKITDVGDANYARLGSGAAGGVAPSGIQIGTASTAVAKNGAGSFVGAYLIGQAFDSTPTVVSNAGAGGVVTYKVTFAAGTGTTASPITEAAIVTGTVTAAPSAAATTARVLLSGIGSKGASDTLTVTWTHTLLG